MKRFQTSPDRGCDMYRLSKACSGNLNVQLNIINVLQYNSVCGSSVCCFTPDILLWYNLLNANVIIMLIKKILNFIRETKLFNIP